MIAAEEGFGADAAAVTEMFTFSHQVVQICFKAFQKWQTEKSQIGEKESGGGRFPTVSNNELKGFSPTKAM